MTTKQWLVDIPPEIRNQVYRALFQGSYVAMTPHKHDQYGRTPSSMLTVAAYKSLSLTSKAVRGEASAFYFSEAEFVIEKMADCNQAPTLALDKRTIHLTCHTESLWEVGEIARYLTRHVFKVGLELKSLTMYGNEVIRWVHGNQLPISNFMRSTLIRRLATPVSNPTAASLRTGVTSAPSSSTTAPPAASPPDAPQSPVTTRPRRKAPALSLEHFLLRSRVLGLYRNITRAVYRIPDADARREPMAHAKGEFMRNKDVRDTGQIRYLVSTGKAEWDTMRRYVEELAMRAQGRG
ncbi:hypothetical protein PMZ80_004219 [Knufia obscura]|uniref:LYR motif-containing protein 2 n=1 Tax=Knufia obscura TaxID=1635080 RepID=A0ABR0RRN1_9EURO|nr:hypothetical protein PMZ80_004219 [Knufia obscura]